MPSTATPITALTNVRAESHPQELPWVIASSTADKPTPRPTAPAQSTVPAEVRGRAGITSSTTTITRTVNAVVSQNTR